MNQLTQEQVEEFNKCKEDPVYFINNYVKLCEIFPSINLYDYQENLIRHYHENQFSICKAPRQSGKSLTAIAYALHYMLFNDNQTIGLFTVNKSISRNLLDRLKTMFVNLPKWMRQEVIISNDCVFTLENQSRIVSSHANSIAATGWDFDILFLDEFAFVDDEKAIDFWDCVVVPVIHSKKSTKVIILSTPFHSHKLKEVENDEGDMVSLYVPTLFYKLWNDANRRTNNFYPISIYWNQMSGKDEKWKEEKIKMIGNDAWDNEYECEFISKPL